MSDKMESEALIQMIALFLIWFFFNGRAAWDVFAVGVAVCLLIGILLKNAMDYSIMKELRFIMKLPHTFRYLALLVKEVATAAWAMVKVILNPWSRLEGQLYFFTPELEKDSVRTVLANSITLTPGTITVQLKNGRYCVHTVKTEFIEDIEHSTLVREAERLEGKFEK